eukprot:CAMPEP_0174998818 /NCGR_PEP_ID=MMETSP0005-20121125/1711_1 /TAXON_ID=420556 /ORGANISM="Ochromonas sp., Strain CCMP1393" /LENGTH=750 /DNA_ID=CAMNT_0016253479 /DNA_START=331 /DNA_END=2583 /DNA_ORIENTATION=+
MGGVMFALSYGSGKTCNDDNGCSTNTNHNSASKFHILSGTTLIFSIAFASTAVAVYFWQQVIIRIVMGMAQSIITPFSTSIISDLFPASMLGSAFGIFNSGTYFAFSLSLSLGTFIYLEYGWQAGYLLFGLVGIACALCMPIFSCLQLHPHQQHQQQQKQQQQLLSSLSSSTLESERMDRSGIGSSSQQQQQQQQQPQQKQGYHKVDTCDMEEEDELGDNKDSALAASSIINDAQTTRDNTQTRGSNSRSSKPVGGRRVVDRLHDMIWIAYDICCVRWRAYPAIYTICLATGIRLGAGYVWSSYTSVFFSELLIAEEDSPSCEYSYSSMAAVDSPSSMCGSDFPYCSTSSSCCKLSTYPWHSEGMDSLHLEEYMSWVPVIGSACGSLLGGFLSDYIMKQRALAYPKTTGTSTATTATTTIITTTMTPTSSRPTTNAFHLPCEEEGGGGRDESYRISRSHNGPVHETQQQQSSLFTTSSTSINNNNNNNNNNNTSTSYNSSSNDNDIHTSTGSYYYLGKEISTTTTSSALVNPIISDDTTTGTPRREVLIEGTVDDENMHMTDRRSSSEALNIGTHQHQSASFERPAPVLQVDQSFRLLIAGWSNILALPLVALSLFLNFPYCFLIYIPSGMIGELYLSQMLAVISDHNITEQFLVTQTVALFMFIITIIGGNIPVLIPFVASLVGYGASVDISFEAAALYTPDQDGSVYETFTVEHRDPRQLQYSLLWVLCVCYGLSGVLYLVAYLQMKR